MVDFKSVAKRLVRSSTQFNLDDLEFGSNQELADKYTYYPDGIQPITTSLSGRQKYLILIQKTKQFIRLFPKF